MFSHLNLLIQVEFILVRYRPNMFNSEMVIQLSTIIYWVICLFSFSFWKHYLYQILYLYACVGDISGLLFNWYTCLFLCQYCAILISYRFIGIVTFDRIAFIFGDSIWVLLCFRGLFLYWLLKCFHYTLNNDFFLLCYFFFHGN